MVCLERQLTEELPKHPARIGTRRRRLCLCHLKIYSKDQSVATEAKLEAFEMWLYRRMLRVSWTQRVTNEEILRRMGKAKEVLATVKRRKLQYLGHIMRHEERYQLPICILQGKILGARGRGRRRISWLRNLREWFNQSTPGLFRAAVNRGNYPNGSQHPARIDTRRRRKFKKRGICGKG